MARKLWKDAENVDLDVGEPKEAPREREPKARSMERDTREADREDARPSNRTLIGGEGP